MTIEDLEHDADPTMYRRSGMLANGLTLPELQRLLERGNLTRVRRGTYFEGPIPARDTLHRMRLHAAIPELADGAVVSHASAALLHGLPVWGVGLDQLTITRARPSGGRVDRLLHTYTAALAAEEITELDDIPVTTVARTIVDLARKASHESAVVTADAALARGLTCTDELTAVLDREKGWPGIPRARRVVAFADGRSESVGESRSRVAIARAGLPDPVLQWEVQVDGGRRTVRTDFGWPAHKVIGEFDGRIKYQRLLRAGQLPGDAVWEEKLREEKLREEDLVVVRWVWSELSTFTAKLRRVLS